MIMKGQKRKHQPEDIEDLDRNGAIWERQRQSVFCISLDKYQRGHELPEPSLRRSVLIANTLRQITFQTSQAPSAKCADVEVSQPSGTASALQESDSEGMFPRMAAPNRYSMLTLGNSQSTVAKCLLSNQSGVSHHDCTTTRSPSSCLSTTSHTGDVDEDWGSMMSSDHDFSLSAAISSILTALDSTMDGGAAGCNAVPQIAPRAALRSLENLTGDPEADAVSGAKHGLPQVGHWGGSGSEHQEAVCRLTENNVEEVMRCSDLGDLASMDDLFQDIDTSLLEREMGSLGVRGGSGGGGGHLAGDELLRYLSPLSLTSAASCPSSSFSWSTSPHPATLSLNQSLKCLPSFSSFSSSSSASCSPSHPSSSALFGQSHVRDLHDLEHLMEVLVES